MKFKVGSDPELFLVKDRELVSAIPLIPYSKDSPLRTKHGWIQQDNVLAEFNTLPANNLEEFVINHQLVIKDLEDYLADVGVVIDTLHSSRYCNEEVLSDLSALSSGCNPDYSAWTNRRNPYVSLANTNLRVAGGHLHISIEEDIDDKFRLDLVKALDLTIGIDSVIDDDGEDAALRRNLYGKAGSYRPKNTELGDSYNGVEYRTLSNYWVRDDRFIGKVYSGVEYTISNLPSLVRLTRKYAKDIVSIINTSDVSGAISFRQEIFNYAN